RPAVADLGRRHQRLGQSAAAGQVHRHQVQVRGHHPAEVVALGGGVPAHFEVGQDEAEPAEGQRQPDRDDRGQVQSGEPQQHEEHRAEDEAERRQPQLGDQELLPGALQQGEVGADRALLPALPGVELRDAEADAPANRLLGGRRGAELAAGAQGVDLRDLRGRARPRRNEGSDDHEEAQPAQRPDDDFGKHQRPPPGRGPGGDIPGWNESPAGSATASWPPSDAWGCAGAACRSRNRLGDSTLARRRSQMNPAAKSPSTTASTSWPTGVPNGSTKCRLKIAMPSTNTTTTVTMICTERRVPARCAMTRWRMSTSSRSDLPSAVSTSRSPGPRSLELRISAAITRSADGSFRSSARCCKASDSGIRPRSRSSRALRLSRSTGSAPRAEDGIACSRPTAPAIVSRSASVHIASASTRRIASFSAAAPPNSWFQNSTNAIVPSPSTGHWLARPTTRPMASAITRRWPSLRIRSASEVAFASLGLPGQPISPATRSASPSPAATPTTSA